MADFGRSAPGPGFVKRWPPSAVILPLFAWLVVAHCPDVQSPRRCWPPGLTESSRRWPCWPRWSWRHSKSSGLARLLPPPGKTDLFLASAGGLLAGRDPGVPAGDLDGPPSPVPGLRGNPIWGVERPALETWAAALAFAPLVAWLGNPLWWRDTLPRLAHYLMLNAARRGGCPTSRSSTAARPTSTRLPWKTPGC